MTDTPQTDPAIAARVWEHALHEEKTYNDRMNFFLVAEAMLLVFYATLETEVSTWILVIIAALGLATTVMWMMVNARQREDLAVAIKRLEDYCPEYPAYREEREQQGRFRASDKFILGVCVPWTVALIWVVLMADVASDTFGR